MPEVADLLGAIDALTGQYTPRGRERATAYAVARWASDTWSGLQFHVDQIGDEGANLVGTSGSPSDRDLLFCSHLDTSLTGFGAEDCDVTGSSNDAALGFEVQGNSVSAFGLGVARGPAAAALVAFACAASSSDSAPLRLVLAGGGTHENPALGDTTFCGLENHLASYPRPAAAVVAKAGPRGILWDEPGAGYLRVRVTSTRGAILMRNRADPPGGLPTHVGTMCSAIEAWREAHTASPARGQSGPEAGIGAIRTGSTRKPDLLPAFVDLFVYVVTSPGDELHAIADGLLSTLLAEFAKTELAGCGVQVDVTTAQNAGVTSPDSVIVRAARGSWERHHGEAAPVLTGWTGSTDGALLRDIGIDTVRTGPATVTGSDTPGWDTLDTRELRRFAQMYTEIGRRWTVEQERGK